VSALHCTFVAALRALQARHACVLLPCTHMRAALRAMQMRPALVLPAQHHCAAALRAMQARHARVRHTPHPCAGSATLHLCAGITMHTAGETRTCPPCPAPVRGQRFTLSRQDTHVSALPRTCVRDSLSALQARHARVCPAPHLYAGPGKRFALCGRSMHMSARPRTRVRAALHTTQARHACVRPAPHVRAGSASRYAGKTRTCPPCPAPMCGLHSHYAGETRTCPPCPSPMCGTRFVLYRRDPRVSALPRT